MKNLEKINSGLFNLVKKEKEIEFSNLYLKLETTELKIRESIAKLKTEYKLIFIANGKISLTEKGEKFKDFESYIKSLNNKPWDWYKITTVIFGLFSVCFLFLNYNLKKNESNLKDQVDSLTNKYDSLTIRNSVLIKNLKTANAQLLIHKDSLAEYKGKLKMLKLKTNKTVVISGKKND